MPRTHKRRSLGSVSLLFLAVILPLLMVFLCLGTELTHFFGAHDDVQRIVDRATRASLTKGLTEEETEQMLRRELSSLSAMLEVESVRHRRGARVSDTQVDASFRGIFSGLTARLMGAKLPLLPVHVSARVRKVEAKALVLLDRSVVPGAPACGGRELQAVEGFADRLASGLLASGVGSVSVAVVPGASSPVELLSAEAGGDLLERCRDRLPDVPFDASSIAGSGEAFAAETVAAEVLRLVESELFGSAAESRSVIFVGQGASEELHGYAQAVFGELNAQMEQRASLVAGTHVMLGGAETQPISVPRAGQYGVELRTVRATERELGHPNLVAAVRGRAGEKTVLVF